MASPEGMIAHENIQNAQSTLAQNLHPKEFIRYCQHCGATVPEHDGKVVRCLACGHVRYINCSPTVCVILYNETWKVLFTVRARDPFKGTLDMPWWFINPWGVETVEEAAYREIKEELGVEIRNLQFVESNVDEYAYGGWTFPISGFVFSAEIVDSSTIKASDDISAIVWYSWEEIPLDHIKFPSMRGLVERQRAARI